MATKRDYAQNLYGWQSPITIGAPKPKNGNYAPTVNDQGVNGQIWIYDAANTAFVCAGTNASGQTIWLQIADSSATLSSLTVTPGPISLTGTTSINTTGAAHTAIGTGGTGTVAIGNASGTTFTGVVDMSSDLINTADVVARSLFASGDQGTGVAAETAITNVVNTAVSTGALTVLSTTANPGNSAGFIKIYVGTQVAYVPYFTNIAP